MAVVCLQSGGAPDAEAAKRRMTSAQNGARDVNYDAYDKPTMAAHSDSLIMAYSNPAMDLSHESNDRHSYEMLAVTRSSAQQNNVAHDDVANASPKPAPVRVITVETHSSDASSVRSSWLLSSSSSEANERGFDSMAH